MLIFKKIKDPENHFDVSDLTMEVDAVVLTEIIDEFANFLKGCGYIFDGLEIVDRDEDND